MRSLLSPKTDPTFNLAAEEWLLRNVQDDIFMLWRNAQAVIVGRHQNTAAEINQDFITARKIPVVRRLTGGGAVFHDLGNVNFTFIQAAGTEKSLDFHRFTAPICQALNALGTKCQFEGRNDLTIEGMKISGNAQLLEKNRVLHHGTLLFSSSMQDISTALTISKTKYADRAVKSVAKRVTTIEQHLSEAMSVEAFLEYLMREVTAGQHVVHQDFSESEHEAIEALAESRYRTWEWNFGSSPKYNFFRETRTRGGTVEVHLDVQEGVIFHARIFGDFFGIRPIHELETLLCGCRHDAQALQKHLAGISIEEFIHRIDAQNFFSYLV